MSAQSRTRTDDLPLTIARHPGGPGSPKSKYQTPKRGAEAAAGAIGVDGEKLTTKSTGARRSAVSAWVHQFGTGTSNRSPAAE
ncbi:MAG: hypothetical protein DMF92_17235 [Acidobacteria bacterium]|nr:MAG: hypothetical protein DMF92_17235 [Acidobacteriota bacterium]